MREYCLDEARKFFKKVYGMDFDWLQCCYKDEYTLYSDEVLYNWNNKLYYSLEPYSRAMLYLPSKADEIMERIKNS